MSSLLASAQTQIDGRVSDSHGEALSSVSVIAYADSLSGSPMAAYSITDTEGKFRITLKQPYSKLWLIARCIGYDDYKVCVVPDSLLRPVQITMMANKKTIAEVVVKGKYTGVKLAGDTVKFDTDHFRDGSENSIGDVLGKLPGVSVGEDGSVSYGGKSVGHVLMDGKEVFSDGGSGLVIKNMSGDVVAGADIIRNYNNGRLTSSFNQGEDLALDIRTKSKGRITGNVEAYGGVKDKYEGRTVALYRGRNLSLTTILTANNLGKPVFTLKDYMSRMMSRSDFLSGGGNMTISGAEAEMMYRPENLSRDEGRLASVDAHYQKNNKLTLDANVMLNQSKPETDMTRHETYLSDRSTVLTALRGSDNNRILLGKLYGRWTPTGYAEFTSTTNVNASRALSANEARSRAIGVINYNDRKRNIGTSVTQNLAARIKHGAGLIFADVNVEYSYSSDRFALRTDSTVLPSGNYVDEGLAAELPYLLSDGRKYDRFALDASFGYAHNFGQNYKLNASAMFRNDSRSVGHLLQPSVYDNGHILIQEYSARVSMKSQFGKFSLKLGADGSVETERLYRQSRDCRLVVYPNIEAGVNFSPTHTLSLSLSRGKDPVDIYDLARFEYVDDYNSLFLPSLLTDPYLRSTDVTFSYFNHSIERQGYIVAFANYKVTPHALVPNIVQNGLVSTTAYSSDRQSRSGYVSVHAEKRWTAVPLKTNASILYSYASSPSVMNGADYSSRNDILKADVSVSSSFRTVLNFELKQNYSRTWNRIGGAGVSNNIDRADTEGRLLVSKDKLFASLSCAYQYSKSSVARLGLFDLGFAVRYKVGRISLKVEGQNILHLANNSWQSISSTPYFTFVETFRRLPGSIVAGAVWVF